jgi:hypothetical protein
MLRRHVLYPSELRARSRKKCLKCSKHSLFYLSLFLRASRFLQLIWPSVEELRYAIARERIPFASFSISSAFFTITTESTCTESVFSTSAFNSLAS